VDLTEYEAIIESITITREVENFVDLLKNWPTEHSPWSKFENWIGKMESKYIKIKPAGALIIEAIMDEKDMGVASNASVKDGFKIIAHLLKPFPKERTLLTRTILAWKDKNHTMNKVINLPQHLCTTVR